MTNINVEWHTANRMPKNPTKEQRLYWHLHHSKNCSCRTMPNNLRQEVEELEKKLQETVHTQ